MKTLYFATLSQVFHHLLEGQVRLVHPFFERRQVLRILRKAQLHSLVHKLRNGLIRLRCLQAQGAMNARIEIHRSSLL